MNSDPEAAKEAKTASDLAQRRSLPLEYVLLARAKADGMDKRWDDAISSYYLLFSQLKRLDYGPARLRANRRLSCFRGSPDACYPRQLPAPIGNDPRIQLAREAYRGMNDFNAQLASAQAALKEAENATFP